MPAAAGDSDFDPVIGSEPLQAPLAAHAMAFVADHVRVGALSHLNV